MSSAVTVGLIATLIGAGLGAGATLSAPWITEYLRARAARREHDATVEKQKLESKMSDRERTRQAAIRLRTASRRAVEELTQAIDTVTNPSATLAKINILEIESLADMARTYHDYYFMFPSEIVQPAIKFIDSVRDLWGRSPM